MQHIRRQTPKDTRPCPKPMRQPYASNSYVQAAPITAACMRDFHMRERCQYG
ncbi:hypothetical protein APS_1665 [Acetobacter pasteurianus subsp. pasteurianus LMG 1262 = NBRC 106471]|nr:hypothetical protein APS_1665 [Acetobacter pasteurianus subsp. pasteurianus LMG 1262 = NBRC 106471]